MEPQQQQQQEHCAGRTPVRELAVGVRGLVLVAASRLLPSCRYSRWVAGHEAIVVWMLTRIIGGYPHPALSVTPCTDSADMYHFFAPR
jgi:hypothetical protein